MEERGRTRRWRGREEGEERLEEEQRGMEKEGTERERNGEGRNGERRNGEGKERRGKGWGVCMSWSSAQTFGIRKPIYLSILASVRGVRDPRRGPRVFKSSQDAAISIHPPAAQHPIPTALAECSIIPQGLIESKIQMALCIFGPNMGWETMKDRIGSLRPTDEAAKSRGDISDIASDPQGRSRRSAPPRLV